MSTLFGWSITGGVNRKNSVTVKISTFSGPGFDAVTTYFPSGWGQENLTESHCVSVEGPVRVCPTRVKASSAGCRTERPKRVNRRNLPRERPVTNLPSYSRTVTPEWYQPQTSTRQQSGHDSRRRGHVWIVSREGDDEGTESRSLEVSLFRRSRKKRPTTGILLWYTLHWVLQGPGFWTTSPISAGNNIFR